VSQQKPRLAHAIPHCLSTVFPLNYHSVMHRDRLTADVSTFTLACRHAPCHALLYLRGGPKGNRSGVTPTSVVNLYGYEPEPEKVISTK